MRPATGTATGTATGIATPPTHSHSNSHSHVSYRMIPDLATGASGTSACFLALGRALALFWGLSVDLLASLECFAFDLGTSDPDFARRGSPHDALGIVFGGRNEVIWKISGECTGFVASIAFAYDFRVFWHWFSDRLSALFLITLRLFWHLMAAARVGLKARKTLAGAIKIKVRRYSGFYRATMTPSGKAIEMLSGKNNRKTQSKIYPRAF